LPLFPKRYCSLAQLKFKKLAVLLTKASPRIPIVDFVDYQQVLSLHVVWKSIESLGRIGVIARAVPECRTIVILRQPCGYIASVLKGEDGNRFSARTASGDDFPVFEMLLRQSPHKERNPSLEELKTLPMEERLACVERILRVVSRSDLAEIYLKSCAAQTRAPASASSISMADTNQTACP
jgi:hypothetical protein